MGSSEVGIVMVLTIAAMPAYNEERSIADVIGGCHNHVDKVVVIDDGSSDSTAQVARDLGAYVVSHPKNMGYGAALRSCFEAARELGADRMVIIDSDGQHDCSDIPRLLCPLGQGYDIVIGSRFIVRSGEDIPLYRKAGMKVLDLLTNFIGDTEVTDSQSGFRAYGRRAIETLKVNGNGMSAGSEILLQIKDNDLKVKEVDISCKYDLEDTSTQDPFTHALGVVAYLLSQLRQRKPACFFSMPGIAFAGLGIGLGYQSLTHGGGPSIAPTALMVTLVFAGAAMAFTGISKHWALIRSERGWNESNAGSKTELSNA
jgi:glycosyltransferase involved in cell wall biosynthesis